MPRYFQKKRNPAERSYILSVLTLLVIPLVVHIWHTSPVDFIPSLTDTLGVCHLWQVPFTMLVSYIFDIFQKKLSHVLCANTSENIHESIIGLVAWYWERWSLWFIRENNSLLLMNGLGCTFGCHQLCCRDVPTRLRSGCCKIQLFQGFFLGGNLVQYPNTFPHLASSQTAVTAGVGGEQQTSWNWERNCFFLLLLKIQNSSCKTHNIKLEVLVTENW